jgi:hypothetical protein
MSGFDHNPNNFNIEGVSVSLCLTLQNIRFTRRLGKFHFKQLFGKPCDIILKNDADLRNNLVTELNKLFSN